MRRTLAVLLALLLCAAGSAQSSWGVKLTLDLPVSDAPAFIASPWGYATQSLDVLDIRAYAETGRVGVEARLASASEVSGGLYYVLSASQVLGQMSESTIGLYVGQNFKTGATVLTVRGTLLLYGYTQAREPETKPELPP